MFAFCGQEDSFYGARANASNHLLAPLTLHLYMSKHCWGARHN